MAGDSCQTVVVAHGQTKFQWKACPKEEVDAIIYQLGEQTLRQIVLVDAFSKISRCSGRGALPHETSKNSY